MEELMKNLHLYRWLFVRWFCFVFVFCFLFFVFCFFLKNLRTLFLQIRMDLCFISKLLFMDVKNCPHSNQGFILVSNNHPTFVQRAGVVCLQLFFLKLQFQFQLFKKLQRAFGSHSIYLFIYVFLQTQLDLVFHNSRYLVFIIIK